MSNKAIIKRLFKLENDMYGNHGNGCKAVIKALKSSFIMLKFMFCAMLSLQIVMISILLVYMTAAK